MNRCSCNAGSPRQLHMRGAGVLVQRKQQQPEVIFLTTGFSAKFKHPEY